MSSMNSFCAVSETFSALMVNGPLASANGVTVVYRQQTGSDLISLGIVRNFVKRTEAARIEIIKLLNYISC